MKTLRVTVRDKETNKLLPVEFLVPDSTSKSFFKLFNDLHCGAIVIASTELEDTNKYLAEGTIEVLLSTCLIMKKWPNGPEITNDKKNHSAVLPLTSANLDFINMLAKVCIGDCAITSVTPTINRRP